MVGIGPADIAQLGQQFLLQVWQTRLRMSEEGNRNGQAQRPRIGAAVPIVEVDQVCLGIGIFEQFDHGRIALVPE